jgi:hypothetical protein
MTDTPDHIKQIQLQIWLSKPPMERLKQMMEDNEALFRFWNDVRFTTPPATQEKLKIGFTQVISND